MGAFIVEKDGLMVRFTFFFSLALAALAVALSNSLFSSAAIMVAGLTAAGLAVSLYAEFSRYS